MKTSPSRSTPSSASTAKAGALTPMTATLQFSDQLIADVLCSALEGATRYWCKIVGYREPTTLAFRSTRNAVFPHLDYPMNPGGAVYLQEIAKDESGFTGPRHCLTRAALLRGLARMADPTKARPRHLLAILAEQFDAETGDVLLQLALLGQIKYG